MDTSSGETNRRRIREQIVFDAARLLHEGRETNIAAAKRRAARTLYRGYIRPDDYPTDAEVATAIQQFETQQPIDDRPEDTSLAGFETLLRPLERVELPKRTHPEGTALYHSLQVFVLCLDARPYDEELASAGLLHEVGWAVDPWNVIEATLEIVEDLVSDRTLWLIRHLPEANRRFDGSLGTRARKRLASYDDYEELVLLSDCDRAGRVSGAIVPTIEQAVLRLSELAEGE